MDPLSNNFFFQGSELSAKVELELQALFFDSKLLELVSLSPLDDSLKVLALCDYLLQIITHFLHKFWLKIEENGELKNCHSFDLGREERR